MQHADLIYPGTYAAPSRPSIHADQSMHELAASKRSGCVDSTSLTRTNTFRGTYTRCSSPRRKHVYKTCELYDKRVLGRSKVQSSFAIGGPHLLLQRCWTLPWLTQSPARWSALVGARSFATHRRGLRPPPIKAQLSSLEATAVSVGDNYH